LSDAILKVLLIYPPFNLASYERLIVAPPLGLAYIGAVLEEAGYKVRILDTVALNWRNPIKIRDRIHLGQKWEDISDEIKRSKPDAVGISCPFSCQSHNAHKVAELVKAYDTDVPVIMGGAHPSTLPERVLRDQNVDYVVIGEGELTMLNLLKTLSKGASFNGIDGFAYREEGKIVINPKKKFIEDLDSLPLPARHLLPMNEYFNAKAPHGPELMRSPFTSMITSRGCPYNCVFCSIHTVWGHKWRPRSPDNVVLEIEHLIDVYKIREIHFEDDNLALNKRRMEKICDLILDRGLDIKWFTPNGVAIWTLDKNLLEKMKKSGCYKLSFGIESGDPETLRFIGKPVDLTYARKVIQWANELGIWTHGFFVIGFPYESKASIDRTLRFATESDLDFASFFIATPLPGTRLLEIVKKEGLIENDPNWANLDVFNAALNTKFFTIEEIDSLQRDLYVSFLRKRILNSLQPRKFALRLKKVRSTEDLLFLSRLSTRFLQIIKRK
jgi:magnesium-protoporphyrin IX monomethyl ester (oxidative) cyclase